MSTSTPEFLQREPVPVVAVPFVQNPHRPWLSAILVLAGDIVVLRLILWAFFRHTDIMRHAAPNGWFAFAPLLSLFLVLYWLFEVYPGVRVSPVDEIRRVSLANASAFFVVSLMLALEGAAATSQLICLLAWMVASTLILVMRTAIRRIGSRYDWWGYPIICVRWRGDRALRIA